MVEPTAVNRVVVGSSPTRGAKELKFLVKESSQMKVWGLFLCWKNKCHMLNLIKVELSKTINVDK